MFKPHVEVPGRPWYRRLCMKRPAPCRAMLAGSIAQRTEGDLV